MNIALTAQQINLIGNLTYQNARKETQHFNDIPRVPVNNTGTTLYYTIDFTPHVWHTSIKVLTTELNRTNPRPPNSETIRHTINALNEHALPIAVEEALGLPAPAMKEAA